MGSAGLSEEHRELRDGLVERLEASGAIRTARIADAFRTVPRHVFVPEVELERAYGDEALVTRSDADGRPTSSSSQPAIMAVMLEQLGLRPGQRVLEIGAGTGYNAALIAHAVGATGRVVTVDIEPDLVEQARAHLLAAGGPRVEVACADGAFGWADGAPYDRVILTVGAWDVAPAWTEQLALDGRLVLPLSLRGAQRSVAFERAGDHLGSLSIHDCGFMRLRGSFAGPEVTVPLGDEPGLWLETEEERALDGDALHAALSQPGEDLTTGVWVTAREMLGGASLWLALHEPWIGRLAAMRPVAARGLVPELIRFPGQAFTAVLVADQALAALVRIDEGGGAGEPFELGVRPLGRGAGALAERLAEHVRAWDARGRPSTDRLRIKAHPRETATVDPAAALLDKRHVRLAIDWPDGSRHRREGVEVRRASQPDAEALAEVNVESWQAAYAVLVPEAFLAGMSAAEQAARFRRHLAVDADVDVEVWLAEADQRALAYASFGPSRDEDAMPGHSELYALYVRPGAWRRGLGRLLHERVLERLRARGASQATLWVFEGNTPARAFYEALGWELTSERREHELAGRTLATVRYTRGLD